VAHLPQRVWGKRKKLAQLARKLASQPPDHEPDPNKPVNPWVAAVIAAGASRADQEVYLWPCNVQAWQTWCAVQSQWRSGMAGREGLDYAGVRAYLDEAGLCGDERRDTFKGIRAAEQASLEAWAQQRREQADNQKQ